jgi:hypothetical protein
MSSVTGDKDFLLKILQMSSVLNEKYLIGYESED